jgi:hypothetical protein
MVEEVRPDPVDDPCDVASEGRQGLMLGTAVVWLSPGVPRSVAPSGMLEPATDPVDPETIPPPDIDVAAVFDELEPQLFDWADPPPSKAAFELVPGHGMINGLTPDVLISVEPSGMPPRPDELESSGEFAVDGAPSGEVGPMPGVGLVCACAATIPIQQQIAMKNGYRIELPQFVVDVFLLVPCKANGQTLSTCGNRVSPLCLSEHGGVELVPSGEMGFVWWKGCRSAAEPLLPGIRGHFLR